MKVVHLTAEERSALTGVLGNAPVNRGLSIAEVRSALAAIAAIDGAADDAVTWEDAQMEYVQRRFREATFVVAAPAIAALADKLGV